jgi:hypothetical protein
VGDVDDQIRLARAHAKLDALRRLRTTQERIAEGARRGTITVALEHGNAVGREMDRMLDALDRDLGDAEAEVVLLGGRLA